MKFFKPTLLFIISLIVLSSCSRQEFVPKDVEVQSFVWRGLNAYYLWQDEVPDLADTKFNNDQELYNYLSGFNDPAAFFYSLLYLPNEYPQDPNRTYSWIVDDYIALEQALQSNRFTSGLKLKEAFFSDGSGGYYIYVYDVVIGSDADLQGVTRGMLITEINGTTLTPNNVNTLLSNDTFTIHLADYNMGNPVSNGTTITLTKSQIADNPVKVATTITNGSNKIGYLLYNQFSSNFDGDLNAAFSQFQNEAITDLVIDLRYNGGGSVKSAVYLGSMITGQFNEQLFAQEIWNHKVQKAVNPEFFINNFTNQILNRDENGSIVLNEAINSLGLNTVYFIVSDQTASASELVINALQPYIDVKIVGEQTYGKHVGSITMYDSDDYTQNGANLNTSHTWALQPIVLEIQNANGDNYPDGIPVDQMIEENPGNLGILGDANEPLLERTIQYILTGTKTFTKHKSKSSNRRKWNSSMLYPDYNNMYVELK